MNKPKKRSHTIANDVDMAQSRPPEPPAWITLPEEARPVWDSIVCAREYNAWTNIDLEHAANLACCLADLERHRNEVRKEGDIIENAKGTKVVNPRHALMETLSRRSVALSRMLHVHAEATEGESRHQKQRNQKQKQVADAVSGSDDDLIAKPMH